MGCDFSNFITKSYPVTTWMIIIRHGTSLKCHGRNTVTYCSFSMSFVIVLWLIYSSLFLVALHCPAKPEYSNYTNNWLLHLKVLVSVEMSWISKGRYQQTQYTAPGHNCNQSEREHHIKPALSTCYCCDVTGSQARKNECVLVVGVTFSRLILQLSANLKCFLALLLTTLGYCEKTFQMSKM